MGKPLDDCAKNCEGSLYLEKDSLGTYKCGCYDPKPLSLLNEPCATTEDCSTLLGSEWEEKGYYCPETSDLGKRCTVCQDNVCKLKPSTTCTKSSECAYFSTPGDLCCVNFVHTHIACGPHPQAWEFSRWCEDGEVEDELGSELLKSTE